jgi:hypothetical protein
MGLLRESASKPGEQTFRLLDDSRLHKGPAWEVQVATRPAAEIKKPEQGLRMLRGSYGSECWVAEDEDNFRFWRPGCSLSLDLRRYHGTAQVSDSLGRQNILRLLYFFGFLESGGVMLHASSVVRGGQACVFPGPSGAGKSTVVKNSPKLPILSDELSAVEVISHNSEVLAWGTPFYGKGGHPWEDVAAPVKGLYFLVKDPEHKVVPLSPMEALARLLPCVWVYTAWEPRLKRVFELAAQLAERVFGYALHCRPDPGFWQVIDAS